MSTNLRRSTTKEERTIADVAYATEKTFTSAGDIRLTFQSDLSTLKSKENLQLRIEDLWRTFLKQVDVLIFDSSSSEITGQPPNTLSDTLTGHWAMGASHMWVNPSLKSGSR